MRANYVLIDYENVQPSDIDTCNKDNYKVYVFHGSSQSNIKYELAVALQDMGDRGKYIKIDGNGKDALDFHIAFYIGQLAEQDKESFFHIISKDTGFDPLIRHLKSKKILACRSVSIDEMPKPIDKAVLESKTLNPKPATKAITIIKSADEKPLPIKVVIPKEKPATQPVENIVEKSIEKPAEKSKIPSSKKARVDIAISSLRDKGVSVPKTVKALLNTMDSIFRKQLSEKDIQAVIDDMQKQKIITVSDTKVTYNLSNQVAKSAKPVVTKTAIKEEAKQTKAKTDKVVSAKPLSDDLTKVIESLRNRGEATPRTTTALFNAINHILGKKLSKLELLSLFTNMKKQKIIIVSDDMKVAYNLPVNEA